MPLTPGDEFAGYLVRERLGRGASSEVYRVTDPARTGSVTLKILDPVVAGSPAARARFRHEFEIAAALRHPNIVEMLAHGEFRGRLWLSYEYIDGTPGSSLVPPRRSAPDLVRLLPALAGIAAGLDYAHAHTVVHLDVKPANMLIGADGAAVLTDFGIARRVDADPGPVNGLVAGTIPYAAPELLCGRRVSAATDQYALACSVVEFLTGRTPFPLLDESATIAAHLRADPPDVSWRCRWIPHAVDSILDKALAKDPRARYRDCTEPIRLITRALRGVRPPAR